MSGIAPSGFTANIYRVVFIRSMVSRPVTVCVAVALLAALALGGALLSESVLGLVPCALCLWERWPYRFLLGLMAVALAWRAGRRALMAVAVVAALAGAGAGGLHVGVEQGWWPSPLPECAAPSMRGVTMAERLSHMPTHPAKPCDEPTYLVPGLPLSMAVLNTLLALALSAWLATSVFRTETRS